MRVATYRLLEDRWGKPWANAHFGDVDWRSWRYYFELGIGSHSFRDPFVFDASVQDGEVLVDVLLGELVCDNVDGFVDSLNYRELFGRGADVVDQLNSVLNAEEAHDGTDGLGKCLG